MQQQGFDEFVRAYRPALVRFAVVLSGDRHLAEDLTSDALSNAFEKWTAVGAMVSPAGYVRKSVVNGFLNSRRRAARDLSRFFSRTSADPTEASDERFVMMGRLARLPVRQRSVIVMRYYAGLSDLEIAEILTCEPATVRSHAAQALRRLKIDITAEGAADGYAQ